MNRSALILLLCVITADLNANAPPPVDLHQRVDFEQRLGAKMPMATQFIATDGKLVTLADVADGKPIVLSMGYYECPNICDVMLTAIADAVAKMDLRIGRDFKVIFIGIDPNAGYVEARKAQGELNSRRPDANVDQWHLLSGDETAIRRVADAIGYRYFYDARIDQYIHPSGIVIANGEGTISQYLFGVSYAPESLRLAMVTASADRIGNVIDHLVLLCSGYDPQTGRYSIAVGKVMRLLGGLTVVVMAGLVFRLQRKRSQQQRGDGEGSA